MIEYTARKHQSNEFTNESFSSPEKHQLDDKPEKHQPPIKVACAILYLFLAIEMLFHKILQKCNSSAHSKTASILLYDRLRTGVVCVCMCISNTTCKWNLSIYCESHKQ